MPFSADTSVLLIHITGPDKPGLTHALTSILSEYRVRILDIGQAVIHDALALGLLVEMTEAARSSPVLASLLMKAHELNLQIRFTAATGSEYESWVAGQAKQRSIVTVLGPVILAEHLARISGIIAQNGFNIDRIDRLSVRPPLMPPPGSRACVEFTISGEPREEAGMRGEFLALAHDYDIDIAFQRDNAYRRTRRLVAFDMDSTLIQVEVIDELAKLAGVGDEVARITEAAMRGEIDFPTALRQRVLLLKGLRADALEQVARDLPLTEGAERLVSTLKRLGYKTAILSGGFLYFGRRLQDKLGIDYLYASDLEIQDGHVTGEISSEVVDGQAKARRLREIAAQENISLEQVIAVGDGANDLPMLGLAGLGIAFRAKPAVRRTAQQAISKLGLDGILYLIGLRDRETLAS